MRDTHRRRFDLIAFDWDGTLFDSTGLIVRCIQAACRDLGLPVPDDTQAAYVIGLGLMDALRHAAPDLPVARYPELGRRYLAQTQWRAQGRRFYVDKLPPNWMLVGHLRRALPRAKVLHLVRDPMDVCFSNWRALFGDAYAYSYDFESLARHHAQYRRLMAHWHRVHPGFVLDVPYANLVNDTETICRRVLAFCGLPFEADCLDHTRNRSSVSTLSSAQVREPIHARGIGEWRRYATPLEPLRRLLEA